MNGLSPYRIQLFYMGFAFLVLGIGRFTGVLDSSQVKVMANLPGIASTGVRTSSRPKPFYLTSCFVIVGASLMYWSAKGSRSGGSALQLDLQAIRDERRSRSRMEKRDADENRSRFGKDLVARKEYRSPQHENGATNGQHDTNEQPNSPSASPVLRRITKASRPFIKAATAPNLYIKAARASRPFAKGATPQPAQTAPLPFDEALRRLHRLLEEGLVTEEEYAAKKKQILGLS